MGKIITCPVKRWPGTVTLHDPLTLPMVASLERSISNGRALVDPTKGEIDAAMLPGVLACVEAVNLQGVPPALGVDNFPGSPRRSSAELFSWLLREVMVIYSEETADPLG